MSYFFSFEIDGLPDMVNSKRRYGHWRELHKQALFWKQLVYYQVFRNRPSLPLLQAKLTLIRYSSSEPDYEGLVSGFKHIIDGLVEAKIIENDRMSNIGQPDYQWIKCPKKEGKISVNISEVETAI